MQTSLPTHLNPHRTPLCSIYIRCKNSVQEALYSQMMSIYFKVARWVGYIGWWLRGSCCCCWHSYQAAW